MQSFSHTCTSPPECQSLQLSASFPSEEKLLYCAGADVCTHAARCEPNADKVVFDLCKVSPTLQRELHHEPRSDNTASWKNWLLGICGNVKSGNRNRTSSCSGSCRTLMPPPPPRRSPCPLRGGGGAPAPPDAPAVPSGAVSWCLCCSALIAVFLSDLGPKPKPRERAALKPLALLLSPHAPRVRGAGFGGAGVECGSVRGNKRRFNATSVQVRDGVRKREERERERERHRSA